MSSEPALTVAEGELSSLARWGNHPGVTRAQERIIAKREQIQLAEAARNAEAEASRLASAPPRTPVEVMAGKRRVPADGPVDTNPGVVLRHQGL